MSNNYKTNNILHAILVIVSAFIFVKGINSFASNFPVFNPNINENYGLIKIVSANLTSIFTIIFSVLLAIYNKNIIKFFIPKNTVDDQDILNKPLKIFVLVLFYIGVSDMFISVASVCVYLLDCLYLNSGLNSASMGIYSLFSFLFNLIFLIAPRLILSNKKYSKGK